MKREKIIKIILSLMGGVNAGITIAIPILVSILWIKYGGSSGWSSNLLIVFGIIASLFRAIRIGFLKE